MSEYQSLQYFLFMVAAFVGGYAIGHTEGVRDIKERIVHRLGERDGHMLIEMLERNE